MIRDKNVYKKGLVSVVTPVFNGEKYISRLLNSVLKQSWNSVEMIIVDDGSSDKTVEVVKGFKTEFDRRGYIFKIILSEHINASGAVAKGLTEVTGEYLIWPDGDDELAETSIEKRVQFLEKNEELMCVRSISKYVDFDNGLEVPREECLGDLSSHRLFWDILLGKTFVCCGCYMLRSEEFFRIYGTHELPVYNVGQNFQMLLPYMYFNECPTLEEELYIVYRRADSHSSRNLSETEERKKYNDYELLIDDIVEIIGIKDKEELRIIDVWKQRRRMYIARKYSDADLRIHSAINLFKDREISFLRMCKSIVR